MNNISDKPHGNIKKFMRYFFIGIAVFLLVVVIGAAILFWNELRTLFSITKIDDCGAYQMTYYGDYGFDEFLEVGAESDADIEKFVVKRLLKGLSIDLGITGGGCTCFVVKMNKTKFCMGEILIIVIRQFYRYIPNRRMGMLLFLLLICLSLDIRRTLCQKVLFLIGFLHWQRHTCLVMA